MREWMATPSVMVDEARVRQNVEHMQRLADAHGVALRPHIKTHKTLELTELQLQHGACGITASKPSEALAFFHSKLSGLSSILLAYPVVQVEKLTALLVAAKQSGIEFRLTVDSLEGLEAVEKASAECEYTPKVLLHIDVGYHRVGIEEHDPRLLAFAKRIHESTHLAFEGILSHAGR
jgi:D-serine deaminase-like pyridoxal phosphate-dependent protein